MDQDLQNLDSSFDEVFKSPQDLHPFRLFDLPPELWLHIIELAVTKPAPILITAGRRASDQKAIVRQPALTQTCRLLRREGLRIFYQYNTFEAKHFSGIACPRSWFAAVGPDNLRDMGTFTFYAKFQSVFWVEKFHEIGVKVEVERLPGGLEKRGSVYNKLCVKFL